MGSALTPTEVLIDKLTARITELETEVETHIEQNKYYVNEVNQLRNLIAEIRKVVTSVAKPGLLTNGERHEHGYKNVKDLAHAKQRAALEASDG